MTSLLVKDDDDDDDYEVNDDENDDTHVDDDNDDGNHVDDDDRDMMTLSKTQQRITGKTHSLGKLAEREKSDE